MPSALLTASPRTDTMLVRVIGLVLSIGLGAAPLAAADPPARLAASLRSVQAAFLANDAGRLAACFPGHQPVFVQVPPLERGGFLRPGPLQAFLGRLTGERTTVAFDLAAPPRPERGDERVHVRAHWTYRTGASATLHADILHLVLRYAPEVDEWLIVDVKTATR